MQDVVLILLRMSITAGWLVPVVAVLRLIMKKTPKAFICLLWALVGLRLLLPFSFESRFSLIPETSVLTEKIVSVVSEPENTEISQPPVADSSVPNAVPNISNGETVSNDNDSKLISWVPWIWAVGAGTMLLYCGVSYVRVRRRVKASVGLYGNVKICDDINSPFVVGIFKPTVYLPSDMRAEYRRFVLAHEMSHIKRGDYIWKPLGFLILSVYWFNPLIWFAYIMFCRDIELACDERAISHMDAEDKRSYAMTLLMCSMPQKRIAAYPLAFGEVGVKQRISSVAKYKRPTFWVVFVSVLLGVIVSMLFMTDPKPAKAVNIGDVDKTGTSTNNETSQSSGTVELQYDYYTCMNNGQERGSTVALVRTENKFTFALSYGNGYAGFGHYTESDGYLFATAQEGNLLVFRWEGDSLVFVADKSDPLPQYYDGDDTSLVDGTAFILNN